MRLDGRSRQAIDAEILKFRHSRPVDDVDTRIVLAPGPRPLLSIWGWRRGYFEATGRLSEDHLVLPESLVRAPSSANIIETNDGYEGALYENDMIVASRWWRDEPNEQQWRTFARAAAHGDSPSGTIELATAVPAPAATLKLFGIEDLGRVFTPKRIGIAAAAGFAFAFAMMASQIGYYTVRDAALASDLAGAQEEIQQIEQSRRIIRTTARNIAAYKPFSQSHAVLEAYEAVSKQIPNLNSKLQRFQIQEGALQAQIRETPGSETPALVSALEAEEALDDVFAASENQGEISLTASIREPLFEADTSGGGDTP